MKQFKYYMLAGLAMMMMLLVGCTEDNSMTEYVGNKEDDKENTTKTDEVIEALQAVPGIYYVTLEDGSKNKEDEDDDDADGRLPDSNGQEQKEDKTYYSFYFQQPIDHYHPEAGTYLQHCTLKFKGWDNNVVVYTHGYNMKMREVDLSKHLKANQLNIEHRYFGESLPEPFEDLTMTYLHADQQACDIHRIVSTLKTHLFTTGKWVSTGTSKDGITTALQAYYSDLNGWEDIDAYVPFCAPFMPGTTYSDGSFSCNDAMTGTYLKDVCGDGYEAGSQEAVAYERLRRIPLLVCTNKLVREKAIAACYQASPAGYALVVEQFNSKSEMSTGDLTKDLAAYAIQTYYSALFFKFSYVTYTKWAGLVPDLTPLENGTATEEQWENFMSFYTMNADKLLKELDKHPQSEEAVTRGTTRSATEDLWIFLNFRREDKTAPYTIQAFTELGAADLDYSIVKGTGYLTELECEKVNYQFTTQYSYENIADEGIYKQDKGKLMTDFRRWTETETTQPIIFVYAYNDPWTGAGITDEAARKNPMIEKVVDYIATHCDDIQDRKSYTEESEQAIIRALDKFLK